MKTSKSEKKIISESKKKENIKLEVGKRLCKIRKQYGYNQEFVAKSIGISRASLSYYEKGERAIDIEVLYMLSEFYDISIDYLFGLNGNPKSVRGHNEEREMAELEFSWDTRDKLWGNPDLVELIDDFIAHPDFEKFEELTYKSRYTDFEDYDRKYRSFLVSQLIYSMVADVFDHWYKNNPNQILALSKEQKQELLCDIQSFFKPTKLSEELLGPNDTVTKEYLKYVERLENSLYRLTNKLQHLINEKID